MEGSAATLNGLGLRQATVLKVNVYVAALYVVKPSTDADAILATNTPKELTLHFVRHVSSTDLTEAWEEGFANNAKEQIPVLKERIELLRRDQELRLASNATRTDRLAQVERHRRLDPIHGA